MAVFRVVWQYVGNNGTTFNEVYYKDASTPLLAATTTSSLATARVALMHPLYTLVGIRSSQVDANRITGNVKYKYLGTAADTPGTVSGPSTPGDSIVCQLTAASGKSRKIWMRGAPDSYIQRSGTSGQDYLDPTVKAKLETWFTALQANGYGIRSVSPQAAGPLQNKKILKVDGSIETGTAVVTLSEAPGFGFPARVIIGGASKKDLPALNGRWSIMAAPAGNTVKIPYQTPNKIVVEGGNGNMRQETYAALSVFDSSSCGFDHFGTRTTKNPGTHSRGARRAVRLRTSL